MSDTLYYPILKGKQGEFRALGLLGAKKLQITPVIELVPVPFDYAENKPKKSLADHVAAVPKQVVKGWGNGEAWIDPHDLAKDAGAALAQCLTEGRALNAAFVPVIRVESTAPVIQAAKNGVTTDGRGIVLRVTSKHLTDWAVTGPKLTKMLEDVGASRKDAHLILDFGPIGSDVTVLAMAAVSIVRSVPTPKAWKSLAVASGAFPKDLAAVKRLTIARLPRLDYDLWSRIIMSGDLPRRPIFADYAVGHPEWTERDFRMLTMSGSIRYTGGKDWVIVKGTSVKKDKWVQMRQRSKDLMAQPEFSKLSWGDTFIENCANNTGNTGNATTWRQVGTVRHIVKTLKQTASHP
ncbi:MAG: beta family protein [Armatimonadetes bacterium]|nr:beta family protein [Armatimonadota bacterium]